MSDESVDDANRTQNKRNSSDMDITDPETNPQYLDPTQFSKLFGKELNALTSQEISCKDAIEQLILMSVVVYQQIKFQLQGIFDKVVQSKSTTSSDPVHLFDMFGNLILAYLNTNLNPTKLVELNKQIQDLKQLIEASNEQNTTDEINTINNFRTKFRLIKLCVTQIGISKKTINLMSLGPTGVGKSAFVKKLFNLNDQTLKLKGGLASDTEFVKTYQDTINGILFKYTDCPGFFDSRGEQQDKQNLDQISTYIKDDGKDIDIILWVFKLQDILNLKYKQKLIELTKLFGTNMWKKSMVVLTHANQIPPEEYYINEDGDYDDNISDLEAWTKYVHLKKKAWSDDIKSVSRCSVPIVLTENNSRAAKKINKVSTLNDGTPILETVMLEIFRLLESSKAPIMFLTLAGQIEEKNEDKPKQTKTKIQKIGGTSPSRPAYDKLNFSLNPSNDDDEDEPPCFFSQRSTHLTETQLSLAHVIEKQPNLFKRIWRWFKGLF